MRVGIVGSRRRTDRETIEAAVTGLPIGTVVVTGGANGPDRWAEEAARACGLNVVVHRPDFAGVHARWQAALCLYARNQRIVDDAEIVIAFVAPDRTGGTEDVIRRALRAGKPVELRCDGMKKLKLTRERQERFLHALGETGIVSTATEIAGTSRTRVYELRKRDPVFAGAGEEAEERAADALEAEAWRRAVDGVPEPLVSSGRVVRDDDGLPIAIRRYSDTLMLALLKARRPEKFKDRAVVEHDIADGLADRLEAARQRALAASAGGTVTRLPATLPRLGRQE